MNAPKVTVGVPTFNRSAWLRETIESVLAQTFTSFRLIVSDNASDDETPNVVRSFDDQRIDYVRSDRNVGAIGNLNRLIALAETEFLVLLPDDDRLCPSHLEAAVELLDRSELVGLVHSAYDCIDAQSRAIERVSPRVSRPPVRIDGRDFALEWLMVTRFGPCFPSIVYRTKAIAEAGGFREEEEPFGDRKLWMRIALNWDFGYIAKPLAQFRIHPEARQAAVGDDYGVKSDRERLILYSQINFQRRIAFLDDAPLGFRRSERLRALARLQLLVENAASGLPWNETAARLGNLVRAYPRITLRPAFWRLTAAQLGGRRLRSALRRATARYAALGNAECVRSGQRA